MLKDSTLQSTTLQLEDRWILSRLHGLSVDVNRLFDNYQFGEAGRQIHDFLWGEYCDWFLEMAKLRLYGDDAQARQRARQVLVYVLERASRLLHPIMPFITEEIWQNLMKALRGDSGTSSMPAKAQALMVTPWPDTAGMPDPAAEAQVGILMDLIRSIRNARAEYDVQPGRRIVALIAAGDQEKWLQSQRPILCSLAKLDEDRLQLRRALPAPDKAVALVAGGVTAYLPLAGLVDLDAERERITGELQQTKQRIARSEALLANRGFTENAPAEVVERERDKLADLLVQREKLEGRLAQLTE